MQSKLIYTFCIWLTTILYCHPPPLHLWSPVTSSRRVRRWQWQSILSRDTRHTRTWSLWSRSPEPQSGHRDLYLWPVGCAEPLLLMSITMAPLLATRAGRRNKTNTYSYSLHWILMGFVTGPSSGEQLGSTKSMTSVSEEETTALWMLSPGQTARNVDSKGVSRYELFQYSRPYKMKC